MEDRGRGKNGEGAGDGAATRTYHSPLRERQVEQTRDLIIDALADQVWREGLADFSVPKVARRAGVSTRTVYRYFPNREDLLDAVGEWLQRNAPGPPHPSGVDDVTRYVRDLFAYLDRHPQLVDLEAIPGLGREISERERARRAANSGTLLARWMPEIQDPQERVRRFAPIRVLLSSRAWRMLTREMGFTSEEAAEIACDAIERLIGSLETEEAK